MTTTYDKLEADFNKKVKALQSRCIHGKHEPVHINDWFGRLPRKMCGNCHKYIDKVSMLENGEYNGD